MPNFRAAAGRPAGNTGRGQRAAQNHSAPSKSHLRHHPNSKSAPHKPAKSASSTPHKPKLTLVLFGHSRSTRAGSSARHKGTAPLPKLPKGVKRYSKQDPLTFTKKDEYLVGMNVESFLEWVKQKESRREEINAMIERDWEDVKGKPKKHKGFTKPVRYEHWDCSDPRVAQPEFASLFGL